MKIGNRELNNFLNNYLQNKSPKRPAPENKALIMSEQLRTYTALLTFVHDHGDTGEYEEGVTDYYVFYCEKTKTWLSSFGKGQCSLGTVFMSYETAEILLKFLQQYQAISILKKFQNNIILGNENNKIRVK
jgi:hypothetical protein